MSLSFFILCVLSAFIWRNKDMYKVEHTMTWLRPYISKLAHKSTNRYIIAFYCVLAYHNVKRCSHHHRTSLGQYANDIVYACLDAAEASIGVSGHKSCMHESRVPDWNEYVAPIRNESLFWHNKRKDCGHLVLRGC